MDKEKAMKSSKAKTNGTNSKPKGPKDGQKLFYIGKESMRILTI